MTFQFCPPKPLDHLQKFTYAGGERWYQTPGGKKYPSVTTVIGCKKKESIQEWRNAVGDREADRISKYASARGTEMHALLESHITGKPLEKEFIIMPDTKQMFGGIRKLLDTHLDRVHYIEQTMYSDILKLGGSVDLIGHWDGVLSTIDFKTSGKMKKEEWIDDYFAQCVAYSTMHEELTGVPVDQIVVLIAVEGQKDPQVFIKRTEDHIPTLMEYIKYYDTHR